MTLPAGTRLGVYEITGPLGSGGMGEVYRARDSRLRRDVAIKVLPESLANDPDRLARFEREAQVLASLNHPHIAQIYGLEESGPVRALVMEFVEGEDLSKRIQRGSIAISEAVSIAQQIAEALESAHRRSIVHRDLKPANIQLRPDGTVKVLDFGLAKALESQPALEASNAPTISGALATGRGVIAGTPAYMSPEQATGRDIDKRADIWAFGCVLYEMLAGKRAFPGDDPSDAFQSVLAREPDFTRLPPRTPEPIRRLLRRCLQKDPKHRLHDMADVRIELQDATAASNVDMPAAAITSRGGAERLAWSAAGVLLVAFISALGWGANLYFRGATSDEHAYRTSIVLPSGLSLRGTAAGSFALSPDGRRLAFTALGEDAEPRLWIRSLDAVSVRPLAGTEGGASPFWSPDGRFLAFFAQDKLKKIDVAGGPPVTLADAEGALGGSWSKDDVIVFASNRSGLHTVSASGGTSSPVSSLDAGNGEVQHVWPFVLPDGRHFLYHAAGSKNGGSFDPNGIYAGALGSSERKLLVEGGSNAQYAAGYLLFLRQRTLMAQRFDTERLELITDPVALGEQIVTDPFFHTGAFTVSEAGNLAYQASASQAPSQLLWFDRTGARLGALGESAYYRHPEISPDGARVAVAILDPTKGTRDLWVVDAARGVRTRFTFDETEERFPTWSSDGNRIAFTSGRGGTFDVFAKPSSGTAQDQLLVHDTLNKYPTSWSPDGRFILYYTGASTPGTGNDLWVLPLFEDRKPFQFMQTPFDENEGRFSPDGRWVAYQSRESGQTEVYVAAFPAQGKKWRVSTNGGHSARWGRDGSEILYLAPDNKLMAAAVEAVSSALEVGPPTQLFQTRPAHPSWTLSAEGKRFLINTIVDETTAAPITLFINWTAGLSGSTSQAP